MPTLNGADPWEEGIAYARNGGSLSSLPTVITSLRLNVAEGQTFTLAYLQATGTALGEGARERMKEVCDRYRRGQRRK